MGVAMALDIKRVVDEAFADVPAIEEIYARRDGSTYSVTAIINDEDDSVFDQIYDRERRIIRSHRNAIFDFHVIARRGRPVHEFVGCNQPVWHRSDVASLCLNATNT
jgi:hypothetical protein